MKTFCSRFSTALMMTTTLVAGSQAYAADCRNVRFSDVGWTDITATTALTSEVLRGLGYAPTTQMLSVPVTYKSLANGDIDVFLGNWMPTMASDIAKYEQNGSVETLRANLEGAKYTLAVSKNAWDAGVKDLSDLATNAKSFKNRIYGIEPGNDGNRLIDDMIKNDVDGLSKFTLIESSEAGMLSQVSRTVKRDQWVVFLGWAPHPMNKNFEIEYLTGTDDYFGPDFGGATVYTNVRRNYTNECKNVGKLLTNLSFTLEMENDVMAAILDEGKKPEAAAKSWLTAHPEVLNTWLEGVTTLEGGNGLEAVQAYLN